VDAIAGLDVLEEKSFVLFWDSNPDPSRPQPSLRTDDAIQFPT